LWDILNTPNSPIDKLFVREEALENDLSILLVIAMEVLCLDLILTSDLDSVEHPQLRHVEEALKPVELARLERVDAEINLG